MSKKIRIIAGVIIAAWLLIQLLYFSPFTAERGCPENVIQRQPGNKHSK